VNNEPCHRTCLCIAGSDRVGAARGGVADGSGVRGKQSVPNIAVGGATPKRLYSLLASSEFRSRFSRQSVEWYWGDERVVPYDHPESNYRMVREAMFDKVAVAPETIHPIPTDGSPEDAAWRYERTLQRAYGAAVLDPESPHSSTLLSWLVALTVI